MASRFNEKRAKKAEFALNKELDTGADKTVYVDIMRGAANGDGEELLFEKKLSKEEKKRPRKKPGRRKRPPERRRTRRRRARPCRRKRRSLSRTLSRRSPLRTSHPRCDGRRRSRNCRRRRSW